LAVLVVVVVPVGLQADRGLRDKVMRVVLQSAAVAVVAEVPTQSGATHRLQVTAVTAVPVSVVQ